MDIEMLKKWRLKVAFWKYQHDMAEAGVPTNESFHEWKMDATEMDDDDRK